MLDAEVAYHRKVASDARKDIIDMAAEWLKGVDVRIHELREKYREDRMNALIEEFCS